MHRDYCNCNCVLVVDDAERVGGGQNIVEIVEHCRLLRENYIVQGFHTRFYCGPLPRTDLQLWSMCLSFLFSFCNLLFILIAIHRRWVDIYLAGYLPGYGMDCLPEMNE